MEATTPRMCSMCGKHVCAGACVEQHRGPSLAHLEPSLGVYLRARRCGLTFEQAEAKADEFLRQGAAP
jgi:hypothetical protein